MAGIFSQSLLRHSLRQSQPLIPLFLNRHHSFKPPLIEIDLDSFSSTSSSSSSASLDGGSEAETLAMRRLEDMIHRIIVQKSTPDWLPFIPGSSFWVPPHGRSHNVVDLVSKLANQLTEEELLSLATLRGWPCSSFFLQDIRKDGDDRVEKAEEDGGHLEGKMMVFHDSDNMSHHEDEEG